MGTEHRYTTTFVIQWYTLEDNACKINLYARPSVSDRPGFCCFPAFQHRVDIAGNLSFDIDYRWYFCAYWSENDLGGAERDVY